MKKSVFLSLAFCLCSFVGLAQTNIEEGDLTFKVDVRLVNVSFVLSNLNGKPVKVGRDNIRVKEIPPWGDEAVNKEIKYFHIAKELPLRLGILVDTSGSIKGVKYIGKGGSGFTDNFDLLFYEQNIASEVINIIARRSINDEQDKAFVGDIFFEPLHPETTFTVKQNWTNNIDDLLKSLNEMMSGGLSPLFRGTLGGINQFILKGAEAGEFATALIVISDGQNNLAINSLRRTISGAHSVSVPIYTIGVTHRLAIERDRMVGNLKDMAELTGGRYFELPDIEDMDRISSIILSDIQNRYYIGYPLSEEYSDHEGEVKILIEVGDLDELGNWKKRNNVRLLHRTGYYVTNESPF